MALDDSCDYSVLEGHTPIPDVYIALDEHEETEARILYFVARSSPAQRLVSDYMARGLGLVESCASVLRFVTGIEDSVQLRISSEVMSYIYRKEFLCGW